MRMWQVLLAVTVWVVAASSVAEEVAYIRDEVRVNLRAGPGLQYKILAMLESGDRVVSLATQPDWVQVRTQAGTVGWVPAGLVGAEPPARVRLPQIEAMLAQAQERLRELEGIAEAERSATQRLEEQQARIEELTAHNDRLSSSAAWKTLLAGAGIGLAGMAIGAALSRGSSSTRRIKL
jgi:SH3 domain protein